MIKLKIAEYGFLAMAIVAFVSAVFQIRDMY